MTVREKQLDRATRAGFTLMEMMVVVAILVVLVGVAVPIYLTYLENSKITRARIDIETIDQVVQTFYTKYDQWPPNLEMLTQPIGDSGPMLKATSLIDPWGHQYQHTLPNVDPRLMGQKPAIFTTSPKGREIGNWQDVRESK